MASRWIVLEDGSAVIVGSQVLKCLGHVVSLDGSVSAVVVGLLLR